MKYYIVYFDQYGDIIQIDSFDEEAVREVQFRKARAELEDSGHLHLMFKSSLVCRVDRHNEVN